MSINPAQYPILDSVMCETFVCKSLNFFAPDFFVFFRTKDENQNNQLSADQCSKIH